MIGPVRAALLPLSAVAVFAVTPPALMAQDPYPPPARVLTALPPGDHFEAVMHPSGDTVRYTVHVPQTIREEGRRVPLILALHPGGMAHPWIGGAYLHQLVLPAFEELGAVLVAPDALAVPEAPYRAESFTSPRNLDALLWLTKGLLEKYPIDLARVVVTGYSRGGQGVWYLADRHPELFSAAVSVSARPSEEAIPTIGIPVYLIHSIDDELIGSFLAQAAYQQLEARGARVGIQIVRGPTHYQTGAFVEPLRGTIPWLQGVWEEESPRR